MGEEPQASEARRGVSTRCTTNTRWIPTIFRFSALIFVIIGLAAPHWRCTLDQVRITEFELAKGWTNPAICEPGLYVVCTSGTHDTDYDGCSDPGATVLTAMDADTDIERYYSQGKIFLLLGSLGNIYAMVKSFCILGVMFASKGGLKFSMWCCNWVFFVECVCAIFITIGAGLSISGTYLYGSEFVINFLPGAEGTPQYTFKEAEMLPGGGLLIVAAMFMWIAVLYQAVMVTEEIPDDDDHSDYVPAQPSISTVISAVPVAQLAPNAASPEVEVVPAQSVEAELGSNI